MLATRPFNKDLVLALRTLCGAVGSDYTLAVSRDLARHAPSDALKRDPPEPLLYSCPIAFANDWQVFNLLRKYPGLPGSSDRDRKLKAIDGFIAAEKSCALTNDWIKHWTTGSATPILRSRPELGSAFISEVQREISRILGPFDRKALLQECRWSNGATATSRRGTPIGKKVSETLAVTPRARNLARHVIARDVHWLKAILGPDIVWGPASLLDHCFTVVSGSRVVPVGKNAYTDRTIAAEPALNSFLQQGYGRWLRRRLMKWGCDLDDQSVNQRGAEMAYTRGLSTLDLESASDTVALGLVKLLLPEKHYDYLYSIRSPYAIIGANRLRLEKFSSMGNAFTFEVESLIFYAACRAAATLTGGRRTATVYGDDIVVPRENADLLSDGLELFGFKINRAKSFLDGPFFESCGKHYFKGVDVTPALVTHEVTNVRDAIVVHNKMWRWGKRVHGEGFSPLVRSFLGAITWPSRSTYKQPPGPLDIAYIDSSFSPRRCPSNGYYIRGLESVSSTSPNLWEAGTYAYKLRRPEYLNVHPKGYTAVQGHTRIVATSRWWPEAIWAIYD